MSRFQPLSSFQNSATAGYKLAYFRFAPLEGDRYVLTNQVGEHLVTSRRSLKLLVQHELKPSEAPYSELRRKHFLFDEASDLGPELLALKLRTKLKRLENFTSLHIFVVSLRCEHSCPYCQVSRQSDDRRAFDMSAATAQAALDLVFKSPNPAIKIEFQGGEPLLNFPLIKTIVSAANERNRVEKRKLAFVITTNLAIVSDEHLEFCRQHNVQISTSLDGPADLHNKNRPRPGRDSYERAISGIERARSALGRENVSALMTTTQASLGRVEEIIEEYRRLEFGGVFLRPLSPYGFAVKTKWYQSYDISDWLDFYFRGLEYIIKLNKNGVPFREFYAATILQKMLTPFETGYVDLISPAGIGIGAVVYNYDGDVYASDEARMLAEMGDKSFRLGNVHSDSYEDIFTSDVLLDALEETFAASAPMCSECAFEPYCGSDPVFHSATQGDTVGLKTQSSFCSRNMSIFKYLIKRMEDDREIRNLFYSWAS